MPASSDGTWRKLLTEAAARVSNSTPEADLVYLAQTYAACRLHMPHADYAACSLRYPGLANSIARLCKHQLDRLSPQHVVSIAHSFASVGDVEPEFLEAAGGMMATRLPDLEPRQVSTMLWCLAVADADCDGGLLASKAFSEYMASKTTAGEWNVVDLNQLHQFLLWSTKERSLISLDALPGTLPEECLNAFSASPSQPSLLQKQVGDHLSGFDLSLEHEHITEHGYSLDLVVTHRSGLRIGIEVDGPHHFLGDSEEPTGATLLKRRQLRRLGWPLLPVPYYYLEFGLFGERYKSVYMFSLREEIDKMAGPLQQAYCELSLDPATATEQGIKAAYHRALKEHHPDRARIAGRCEEEASARTRAILAAYKLINRSVTLKAEAEGVEGDDFFDLKQEARKWKLEVIKRDEAKQKIEEKQTQKVNQQEAAKLRREQAEEKRQAEAPRRAAARERAERERHKKDENLALERRERLKAKRAADAAKETEFWATPKHSLREQLLFAAAAMGIVARWDLEVDDTRPMLWPMEQKPRRVYRDWLERFTTEWRERRAFCLARNGRDHSSDDIRDNFIRLGTPFVRKPPKWTMIKWFAIICAADLTWRTVHYVVPNRTPESPLRRLRNRAMAQLLHFESVRSAYVGRGFVPSAAVIEQLGLSFFPAESFSGARTGFVYQAGDEGLGYYRDRRTDN